MTKKTLAIVAASIYALSSAISGVSAKASEDLPIGYYNIAEPYRYVTFATDGGSFIRRLELKTGTEVNLENYMPTKDGYDFLGWYSDPRTKQEQVTKITLNENIVVYAKWISNGSVKDTDEKDYTRSVTNNAVTFQTADKTVSVPVTPLWVKQNARLEYLMMQYNAKFNK